MKNARMKLLLSSFLVTIPSLFAMGDARATTCTVTFDVSTPMGINAMANGYPGSPTNDPTDYADDTFAFSPFYDQQCSSPYNVMYSNPTVYNHYHLNYENSSNLCIYGTSPFIGWFGRLTNGTCYLINYDSPRNLSGHSSDELIYLEFDNNSDSIQNFFMGSIKIVAGASNGKGKIVLRRASDNTWWFWDLTPGVWNWNGNNTVWNGILLGQTTTDTSTAVFDSVSVHN
jgi:hypothetical protein